MVKAPNFLAEISLLYLPKTAKYTKHGWIAKQGIKKLLRHCITTLLCTVISV
jgi:hypothetical protein